MTSLAIIKSLQIYGIATVIAFLVAALIKVMVWVTGRLEQPATAKAQPTSVTKATGATSVAPAAPVAAPVPATHPGIPEEDVAAIFAAIFAAIGPHHILHIGHTGSAWTSQGRAEHHTSHSGLHRPRH